jgi:hypothetical protein
MRSYFLLSTILFLFAFGLYSVGIKDMGTIPIDQTDVILQKISKFSVTEDEYFLFPDAKAGDIKIFNNKGKLATTLGRKGPGPNEYIIPKYCDYKSPYFIFMDWGKSKIFFSEREKPLVFKILKESLCLALGYEIKIIDKNKFLISGYKAGPDGKCYDLYFMDPWTGKTEVILPCYLKYGCSSEREYDNKCLSEIAPLSIKGYCDYLNGYIYFAWQGDLKVLKINANTKNIEYFGKKTGAYIKPKVTSEILRLYNNRQRGGEKIMRKMSFVTGVFTDNDFIGVTYVNYKEALEGWQVIVQFYTLKGEFIEEKELPGAVNISTFPEPFFCYVKEKKMLYFLSWMIDKEEEDIYKIRKYQISLK